MRKFFVFHLLLVLLLFWGCQTTPTEVYDSNEEDVLGQFSNEQGLPEHLKVITYNILQGFRNPALKGHKCTTLDHQYSLKQVTNWLLSQNPDVVCFNELQLVSTSQLATMAKRWNHPYVVKLKPNGFPIGITSKYPIKVIEKRTKDFAHGFLHVKTAGFHLIATHLSPRTPLSRIMEAQRIMEVVSPLISEGEKVLVAGDLNAESVYDKDWVYYQYQPKDQAYQTEAIANFQVMNVFYEGGLIDSLIELNPNMEHKNSWCSFFKERRKRTRIDYILVSKNFINYFSNAQLYETENSELNKISDHFPMAIWY